MIKIRSLCVIGILLSLSACGGNRVFKTQDSGPVRAPDVSSIPDAVPRDEPRSKYGNPKHYEVFGKQYYTLASSQGYEEKGIASWYGKKFHGRRTSSGEVYDMYAMTAAHKTLPLPSYVEVTNLVNGRKVIVKVNDRGPFHDNRLIDLSYTAAKKLDIVSKGTGTVNIRVVTEHDTRPPPEAPVTEMSDDLSYTGLYLQVGAFSMPTSAKQLEIKLQKKVVESVFVDQIQAREGSLYRVRIGPLMSVEHGDTLAQDLVDMGYSDAHIVVE